MGPRYSRYYTYIKPVLQNKYVKTYSSTVFSILTITIFSFFAIKPTLSTIVSLQKSIAEQRNTLEQIKKKEEVLFEARRNYDSLNQESLANLQSLIPGQTAVTNLVASLTNLVASYQASASGIQVQPVDLDGPSTKLVKRPEVKEMDFTLNVQGSYSQLFGILNNMETNRRLFRIRTVDINKTTTGNLVMSINAVAYYFKN